MTNNINEETKESAESEKSQSASESQQTESTGTQKLEDLQAELKKEKDDYLRLRAEFDNYRRRMQEEKEQFSQYAVGEAAKEFLAVLDSIERAEASFDKSKTDIKVSDIHAGFELIKKQFLDTMKNIGLVKVGNVGEKFDPIWHEALMNQESDKPEGEILQVYQSGYRIGEKAIRHAQVVVSKGKD